MVPASFNSYLKAIREPELIPRQEVSEINTGNAQTPYLVFNGCSSSKELSRELIKTQEQLITELEIQLAEIKDPTQRVRLLFEIKSKLLQTRSLFVQQDADRERALMVLLIS